MPVIDGIIGSIEIGNDGVNWRPINGRITMATCVPTPTTEENPAIARVRRFLEGRAAITDLYEDRNFVFALLNDRRAFDAACDGDGGIYDAVGEIIDGNSLNRDEIKRALHEYDRLTNPEKAEIARKIDRLQAELDELRAQLNR